MCYLSYNGYDHGYEPVHESEEHDAVNGVTGWGNCPRCSQAVADLVEQGKHIMERVPWFDDHN